MTGAGVDLFPDSENTKGGMSRAMPLFKTSHYPVLTVPPLSAPSYDDLKQKEKKTLSLIFFWGAGIPLQTRCEVYKTIQL